MFNIDNNISEDQICIEKINESAVRLLGPPELLAETKKLLSIKIPNIEYTPQFRAGLIDGYKKFFKIIPRGLLFPRGLAPMVTKKLKKLGYIDFIYEEEKEQLSREEFDEFIKSLNLPFPPYDYQLEAAYTSIITGLQTNVMCTGSGKSLTIYILCRWYLEKEKKILLMVPSLILLEQMYSDFKSYGFNDIDEYVHRIGGDYKVKRFDYPLTISTWQSIYKSSELFEEVDVIIEDECHKAASEVHESIIFPSAISSRYRFGFTGTLPREFIKKVSILSVLGPARVFITARGLIDRGLATPMVVKAVILKYSVEESKIVHRLKYQQEVEYFCGHKKRNAIIGKMIHKISSSKGNTIVLFSRIAHGEAMCKEYIRAKFNIDLEDLSELKKPNNKYHTFLITSTTKNADREMIRQSLENYDDAVIFGTEALLSTGINIKKLHAIAKTSGGKSSISINQSIGRLLRTHVSKDTVFFYDIVDFMEVETRTKVVRNYFLKHFHERIELYNENDYPIDEIYVDMK